MTLELVENNSAQSSQRSSASTYNQYSSEEVYQASPKRVNISLTNATLVAQRYGVSDRATAAIAMATLADTGLITHTDMSQIMVVLCH